MAIFEYMDGLDNNYLQKVDLKALQRETGMNLVELAKLAEIGPKVIYKWSYMHKDSSRPDYNAIVRLIEHGASVETLFGVDYAKTHDLAKTAPETFIEGLKGSDPEAELNKIVERKVLEMKSKGEI